MHDVWKTAYMDVSADQVINLQCVVNAANIINIKNKSTKKEKSLEPISCSNSPSLFLFDRNSFNSEYVFVCKCSTLLDYFIEFEFISDIFISISCSNIKFNKSENIINDFKSTHLYKRMKKSICFII